MKIKSKLPRELRDSLRYSFNYHRPYNIKKRRLKENIVLCNEPILGIASVMRSGGNLIIRLLDGHSQIRNYPSEFLFGVVSDHTIRGIRESLFPIFNNLQGYKDIFNELSRTDSGPVYQSFHGFRKSGDDQFPFEYSRKVHEKFFEKLTRQNSSEQRDIMNNYLSGFFNAYFNYQSLYGGDKKYTATYWPNFVRFKENVERFFSIYPDGKIIHMLRNPLSWAGSAKKRRPMEYSKDYMDDYWGLSTKNAIYLKNKYLEKYILIDFTSLVTNTVESMQALCIQLCLRYEKSMELPTFNRMPIVANSRVKANQRFGVVPDVIDAYKQVLTKDDIAFVENCFMDLYQEAKKASINQ